MSISQECVRNSGSQVSPQTYCVRTCLFTRCQVTHVLIKVEKDSLWFSLDWTAPFPTLRDGHSTWPYIYLTTGYPQILIALSGFLELPVYLNYLTCAPSFDFI